MTANPGRLALCDHPAGCPAQHRILRGEDTRRSLQEAGWSYNPELCPAHKKATHQTFAEMQAFVGKRCTVWLDEEDPEARVTGLLRALGEDGEVHICTDDGMRYCWPAIAIEAID